MKVHVILLQAVLAATLFCLFSGCEKAFDYLKDHPGENARLCQVQKLELGNYGQTNEISILYNTAGNPTDMIVTSPGFYSTEEYHFRYDKSGRLTDYYFNYYGAIGAVVWHEYSYPDKRTVVDSVYEYTGLISDPVHPLDYKAHGDFILIYSLDASGRIIKTTNPSSDGITPPTVTNFAYDAHGNLVRQGAVYDNKVNVYQTNKVWMFIYNDYSVNNVLAQVPSSTNIQITKYNAAGLPLTINSTSSYVQAYVFNHLFFNLQIVYDCDPSKAPGKW